MGVTLLLPGETAQHAYEQTCRITVPAPAGGIKTEAWLRTVEAEYMQRGNQFIRDKERWGCRYVNGSLRFGGGPFPHIETRGIPSKPNVPKRRPGQASVPIDRIDKTDWDYYTQALPKVNATDLWDYEIVATFTKAILTEFLQEVPSAN